MIVLFILAVFPNMTKPDSAAVLKRIFDFYADKDVEIKLPPDEAMLFGYEKYADPDIESANVDMALSIGGDGTLLGVSRVFCPHGVPVCGVNIGTLGFLADIEPSELEDKLGKLLTQEYYIEERTLLCGIRQNERGEQFLGNAINDVVIGRGSVSRMLHFGVSINDVKMNDYKADGVIVSSATGSTAYSLSAGGPILNPKIKALLITTICAHNFTVRPMVIHEDDKVTIDLEDIQQDIVVTFDGQVSTRLLPGDKVIIKKDRMPAKIVKFADVDYYVTLKQKLWHDLTEVIV